MQNHLLADIGKSIVGAAALGFPASLVRIPLLLAYIIAGVILGPHLGFGIIENTDSISTLSEIGLVFLMFILGIEIDVSKLLQAGKPVLINGVLQVLGCAGLALLFFGALGYGQNSYALVYLAAACSLSSTLIVVKILSDQMDMDALPSRITLGILVLQDLWAVAFLAVQPNLTDLNAIALLVSFSKVGVLVISSAFMARFVLPSIFAKVAKHPELMLIMAMAWCFAMCGLANYLSLSLEMGALVAGVSIASFPYHLDVAAKISSLRDFFITLFFVGLGLQIPQPTSEVLILAGLITIFALLSRILTIFPVMHRMKYGNRASLLPALNLSQTSEFSLVLISLGVAYKHIDNYILSAFVLSLVVTALISSFVIPSAHSIYKILNPWLERIGFADRINASLDAKEKTDHRPRIVLLGFYREASSLLYEMLSRYSQSTIEKLLVVDFNPEAHEKLKAMGINCQYGDISNVDTLRHLGIEHAKLVICTIPDQVLKGTTNLKLLNNLKKQLPGARVIVTAEKLALAKEMYEQGADYVFIPRLVSAYHLSDVIERMQREGVTTLRTGGIEYLEERHEIIP